MHPEPITEFGLPIRYVDAASSADRAEPWWISAEWLHAAAPERADGVALLSEEDLAVVGSGDAVELLGTWIASWRVGRTSGMERDDRRRRAGGGWLEHRLAVG